MHCSHLLYSIGIFSAEFLSRTYLRHVWVSFGWEGLLIKFGIIKSNEMSSFYVIV